jgi:ATP-binding cassette subfamily C protein LapB
VLFLDEPTSAMDGAREAQFVTRIAQWAGRDRTLIIATHKTNVLSIVDKLVVLDGGRVIMQGPRDKVLADMKKMQAAPAKPGNQP